MVAGCQSDCGQSRCCILEEIEMAKSNARRAIIREWISLARDKRQSVQQASAFADAALQRHRLPRSMRPPQEVVMAWLRPRIGRPLSRATGEAMQAASGRSNAFRRPQKPEILISAIESSRLVPRSITGMKPRRSFALCWPLSSNSPVAPT